MENNRAININEFVYLLLATLAQNSKTTDFRDQSKKIVSLPIQYKQIIENILCANNGWKEKFSILIDTEEYFEEHFLWEQKLSLALKQALIDLNKTFEYVFECDQLLISFTQEEIDTILSNYKNEELKNTMSHFASLLVSYIYTRAYQEGYYDYYASSVKKMHNIEKKRIKSFKKEIYSIMF